MEHVIAVKDLAKSFGSTRALNGISFEVYRGEIFGIIGPNGAGKTTTLEILEGIQSPSSGSVEVLGLHPEKQRRELNNRIGVQFQTTSIQKKMKVKEALDLFCTFYQGETQKDNLIEILGLQEKLSTRFEDLSGGWKQRLTLALSTLHKPELLFLDEPSMGLDPHARREMWAMIRTLRDQGSTVVLTTHYMEEAEKLCDRVAMIYSGELKAIDTPRELLDQITTHYIEFESEDLPYDYLLSLGEVSRVEQDGQIFKVYSEDLQTAAYRIFTYCHKEEIALRNFKFEKGSLDDLFVQYLEKEQVG